MNSTLIIINTYLKKQQRHVKDCLLSINMVIMKMLDNYGK